MPIRTNVMQSKALPAFALGLVLVAIMASLSTTQSAVVMRERLFDLLLAATVNQQAAASVVVVDIDRAALEQFGAWPWPRDRLAQLLDAAASSGARVLGLDILLVGDDERSASALARHLAAVTTDPRARALAEALTADLPDADARLAATIGRVPTALGLVLDDAPKVPVAGTRPRIPVLLSGRPSFDGLWYGPAATGAIPALATAAKGEGLLVLSGDGDAQIRRVPLILATDTGLRPGLALETARLAVRASSYLVRATPFQVSTGSIQLRMAEDGMLRLRPVAADRHARRLMSAVDLLGNPPSGAQPEPAQPAPPTAWPLAGPAPIVLIGSSAPELGGLRPSASGDLVPSVQLQADAIEQILAGDNPIRPGFMTAAETMAAFVLTVIVAGLGFGSAPLLAGVVTLTLASAWIGVAWGLANAVGILMDISLVPGTLVLTYAIAALSTAAVTRLREARLRSRFEQHLAPEVVRRIVESPHLLKLEGETREITALFSDIEGFTALTERAGPAELIRVLDRYIEGASRIVVEHGGMVEKIVGDGLHAIFNAPLDLADHPGRALDCAEALLEFTERLRGEPTFRHLALGRTRIGIETGPVIVGDVGGGRRLDYTAHGNAMNRAARLEAANKELGTSICLGPKAASHIDQSRLRPLGLLRLRGVEAGLQVFTTWPADWGQDARDAYLSERTKAEAMAE